MVNGYSFKMQIILNNNRGVSGLKFKKKIQKYIDNQP